MPQRVAGGLALHGKEINMKEQKDNEYPKKPL